MRGRAMLAGMFPVIAVGLLQSQYAPFLECDFLEFERYGVWPKAEPVKDHAVRAALCIGCPTQFDIGRGLADHAGARKLFTVGGNRRKCLDGSPSVRVPMEDPQLAVRWILRSHMFARTRAKGVTDMTQSVAFTTHILESMAPGPGKTCGRIKPKHCIRLGYVPTP